MSTENIEFKMRCKKRKTQRILNLNIDQGTHIKENLTTIFVNSHCSKHFFHQKFQALSACRALNARILFFQKISIVTNSEALRCENALRISQHNQTMCVSLFPSISHAHLTGPVPLKEPKRN